MHDFQFLINLNLRKSKIIQIHFLGLFINQAKDVYFVTNPFFSLRNINIKNNQHYAFHLVKN